MVQLFRLENENREIIGETALIPVTTNTKILKHFQRLQPCGQATMSSLVVILPRGHRVKVATNPNMALLAIKVNNDCSLQI